MKNGGLKVKVGVALTLDLQFPVSVGMICIGGLLESDDLIKTVFEWCRFLLPVWRYGRLNFASKIFWGLNFDAAHDIHLHTYAVRVRTHDRGWLSPYKTTFWQFEHFRNSTFWALRNQTSVADISETVQDRDNLKAFLAKHAHALSNGAIVVDLKWRRKVKPSNTTSGLARFDHLRSSEVIGDVTKRLFTHGFLLTMTKNHMLNLKKSSL